MIIRFLVIFFILFSNNSYSYSDANDLKKVKNDKDAEFTSQELTVGKGDTLLSILLNANITRQDAVNSVAELSNIYNPKALRIGQKLHIRSYEDKTNKDKPKELLSLRIRLGGTKEVEVVRIDETIFLAHPIIVPLTKQFVRKSGKIESSLFATTTKNGIPANITMSLIDIYKYDIDFQRDIKKGNSYKVVYEQFFTPDGTPAGEGDIIFASLKLRKDKEIPVYQFTTADNEKDYYDPDGRSIKKEFIKTPLNAALITSGFGKRRHPVLGYTKVHKGIDFAAPKGTPVYAASKGVIEKASRFSSYGKYIKISHNNGYETAYAHLNRFAPGIKKGSRIEQGQLIGYVGSTGRATGPHLHYELLQNGKQINPLSIKTTPGKALSSLSFAIFQKHKNKIDQKYNSFELVNK